MGLDIATVLVDIGRWVRPRPDLHGLALVGSNAAGRARPDSDVDLVIPADFPDAYQNADWAQAALAGRLVTETYGQRFGNVWSLFVRLAGGPEIEFSFAERSWTKADPPAPEVCRIVRDGLVILYDPRGELLALCSACGVQPGRLS
jgi:predicted secreted hydrolase